MHLECWQAGQTTVMDIPLSRHLQHIQSLTFRIPGDEDMASNGGRDFERTHKDFLDENNWGGVSKLRGKAGY